MLAKRTFFCKDSKASLKMHNENGRNSDEK